MSRRLERVFAAPALVLLAAGLVGCPVNPATGERQLILISESQEIEMGRQGSQQVEAVMGLYDDPGLQDYVNRIGQELATQSEKPNLPWSFKVVDDVIVNAFALPGGFIFVTRGILAHFNSEAELAGVLGHEIGHVTARHSAEQLSRAQFAQIGLVAGSVFVPEFAPYADLAGGGLGLLFLKFGRDDERQADDLGFRYMTRVGYDPREMVDVFDLLSRVSAAAGGGSVPGWLSTHPDPGERLERMEQRLAEYGGTPGNAVRREEYLDKIDGMVFGENPRNGFFRDQEFLHPDLEFRLSFPAGWEKQNTPQAVVGVSPERDAVIQLSLGKGSSVDEAARQFLGQEGITVGGTNRNAVNGLAAYWAEFSASTQDGNQIRGLATFIEYGGRVFQILGYSTSNRFSSYNDAFRRSLGSFDKLTDPQALNVQPRRIELVQLDRSLTIEGFAQRYPSTVPVATLALINGFAEGETIPAGTTLKRVVGGGGGGGGGDD